MKTIKNTKLRIALFSGLVLLAILGCEREITEEAVPVTFPNTAEIFTDDPVGLTDEFFISFDPATGANTSGFGVDDDAYLGSSSIRIKVPDEDDADGGYIGGIFKDRGIGRNLTKYNALTFWAKASTSVTIEKFGFGTDFETNTYEVSLDNTKLSTIWKKIIIPIPDASKLVQESGMFIFSAGSLSTGGDSYIFWIDEIKFENIETLQHPRPSILLGSDLDFISVPEQDINISNFRYTVNSASKGDITTTISTSYFDFSSDDTSIATVTDTGLVNVVTTGETKISASVGGIDAIGSVNVQSFEEPRIISLFSDFYANIAIDGYNGFWGGSTTQGGSVNEDGNNIISYTLLTFVGFEFYGRYNIAEPIDATEMTHFNIDVRVNEAVEANDFAVFRFLNSVGAGETSMEIRIPSSTLKAGEWVSLSIPFTDFSGNLNREALGILMTITDGSIANLSLDNIYLSKVTEE